jgi:hypothetical protein
MICPQLLLSIIARIGAADEDLDDDEAEKDFDDDEEQEDTKMPPKKATPSKKDPDVDAVNTAVSNLSVNSAASKSFELSFSGPYMIKSFIHNAVKGCQVDVFVPTLVHDDVTPTVSKDGMYLEVQIVVPEFFYEEARAMQQHAGIAGVNANTNLITAHQAVVQEIRKSYSQSPAVIAKPQRIKLPFKCKVDISDWEVMNFPGITIDNGTTVHDEHGTANAVAVPMQQYYAVLKVDLVADERMAARKPTGRSRIIQTP